MTRDFSEVLQQAMEFYVAGHLVEARALLFDVVRADPTVEAGWMFLSYTLENPDQKADCLRKVLALNPNNAEAKTTLERLFPPQQKPNPAPPAAHASPFTVDIDHANDDISSAAKEPTASSPFPAPDSSPSASPAVPEPARTPPPATPPFPAPAGPSAAAVSSPAPAQVRPGQSTQSPPERIAAVNPPMESAPTVRTVAPRASAPSISPGDQPPAFIANSGISPKKQADSGQAPAGSEPAKPAVPAAPAKRAAKPTAPPPAGPEVPKKRGRGFACGILVLVVFLIGAGIGGVLWATGNLPGFAFPAAPTIDPAATPWDTPTPYQLQLPPESTRTPVPSNTLTRTISPTPTMSLTPTLALPDATVQSDIDRLMKEVSDLRGLSMEADLPVYVVDQTQAEAILQQELDRTNYRDTIQFEAKSLAALGFIKPTYDLAKYALSRLADGVLGFYMPSARTIYIIGNRFAGMERWTFTHEYDHALVHNFYPAVGIMEDDPVCANDTQRCEAIRALVEGDAVLLMSQWYDQYASAYDKRDIALAPYPFVMPPEQNAPAYMAPLVYFPYREGLNFVGSLWQLGNWERVNRVYDDLPRSTEQILHPEKYLAGERPIVMKVPDLAAVAGDGWTLIESDSLGEFMSYLLLGYGADNQAHLEDGTAKEAAAGWGGDHYLVLSSADGAQVLLAAEWSWDTTKDVTEFKNAMTDYLEQRFRGNKVGSASGQCWSVNEQTTCLYASGRNVLWILAPTVELINTIRPAYPGY